MQAVPVLILVAFSEIDEQELCLQLEAVVQHKGGQMLH